MEKYSFAISNAAMLLVMGVGVQLWFAARLFVVSHAMFMAVGAYVTIHLTDGVGTHIPLPLAVLIGMAATVALAWLIAPLLLKLEEVHLALASLAISELFRIGMLQLKTVTGGLDGLIVPKRLGPEQMLIIALVVLVLSWRIQRRWHGPLTILRFDPRIARAVGIPVNTYQRDFFVIGAAICGLAGACLANFAFFVSPQTFAFSIILTGLIVAVLGAREHWLGPIFGVFVMGVLPEIFRTFQRYSVIAAGVLLILVLQYFPLGVVPPIQRLGRRIGNARRDARAPAALGAVSVDDLIQSIGRREQIGEEGVPAITVEHLTVRYGGIVAVSDVSFEVAPGEILGIIGPNGAGKTTLVNALTGFAPVATGRVLLGADDVTATPTEVLAQRGMVRTFQHAQFASEFPLGDNVIAGALVRERGALGLHRSWSRVRARYRPTVEAFGFGRAVDLLPSSAPLGTRRIAELVRALLAQPSVLVLDEPTAGMDDAALDLFTDLLRALAASGTTILLICHDVGVVQRLSDRVLVMSFGEVLAVLHSTDLFTDERVVEAYLGAST